jgi:predicted nucleic acid-binding protein
MILVDTSVWVDHLARGVSHLTDILEAEQVLIHPFVVGEIACGTLKSRGEVIGYMKNLPQPTVATHEEVLTLIEQRRLMARGIGYIDMHLLASALLTDAALLWTRDRRLRKTAAELDLAHTPPR